MPATVCCISAESYSFHLICGIIAWCFDFLQLVRVVAANTLEHCKQFAINRYKYSTQSLVSKRNAIQWVFKCEFQIFILQCILWCIIILYVKCATPLQGPLFRTPAARHRHTTQLQFGPARTWVAAKFHFWFSLNSCCNFYWSRSGFAMRSIIISAQLGQSESILCQTIECCKIKQKARNIL